MEIISRFLAADAEPFGGFFSFFQQIETIQAIILIAGLVLLIIEIFAPGFGIAGGTGIALLILGIILTASTPLEALIMFLIMLVLVAVVLAIVLRSAKKGRLARTLVLQSAARKEEGYSTSNDPSSLIGRIGVATTHLRPSGSGNFEGLRLDVVSDGSYIDKGSRIIIIKAYGSRIVVEPAEEETAEAK